MQARGKQSFRVTGRQGLHKSDASPVTNSNCISLHAGDDEDVPVAGINALYEVLSHSELLNDAEVTAAAATALVCLSRAFDLPLDGGGRYPGLYRLLAHSTPELHSLVRPPFPSYPLN